MPTTQHPRAASTPAETQQFVEARRAVRKGEDRAQNEQKIVAYEQQHQRYLLAVREHTLKEKCRAMQALIKQTQEYELNYSKENPDVVASLVTRLVRIHNGLGTMRDILQALLSMPKSLRDSTRKQEWSEQREALRQSRQAIRERLQTDQKGVVFNIPLYRGYTLADGDTPNSWVFEQRVVKHENQTGIAIQEWVLFEDTGQDKALRTEERWTPIEVSPASASRAASLEDILVEKTDCAAIPTLPPSGDPSKDLLLWERGRVAIPVHRPTTNNTEVYKALRGALYLLATQGKTVLAGQDLCEIDFPPSSVSSEVASSDLAADEISAKENNRNHDITSQSTFSCNKESIQEAMNDSATAKVISDSGMNVREAAKTGNNELGTLKLGAIVTLSYDKISKEGDHWWVLASFQGKSISGNWDKKEINPQQIYSGYVAFCNTSEDESNLEITSR